MQKERHESGAFIDDDDIWNIIGGWRIGRSGLTESSRFCYRMRWNSGMFTWKEFQSAKIYAAGREVSYRAFFSRSHCNWHNTSMFLSRPRAWKARSEETCDAYTACILPSSQQESSRCPSDHSSMQHCTYWQRNSYSVSIKHLVSESCRYHCEHKSNDWNGHRGEVLMIHNSYIILITKQRHINGLLDNRMFVWAMTFPTIPRILLAKWGQCPMSWSATEAVSNRMDESHISQQHFSKLDIKPYTFRRFARLEVI